MVSKLRLSLVAVGLFLACNIANAGIVPIAVYPNPAQFGTVAQNLTGFLTIYVSNVTADPVIVTGMSISGTNSSDFGFSGPNCVGTIEVGQTCQMEMTFTPAVIGSLGANLVANVQGLSQPVTILLQGTGGSPLPTITSLSPPSAYVNGPAFNLTVNGANFASGAVVYFSNTPLTTTYVSSTQLTAQVPASFLTGTASDWVSVTNPGGGSSGIVYFNVVNLDPFLSNATPGTVVAASAPTPILLNGGSFMTGAKVLWNGKPVTTTYLSSQQLQIQPTPAQLATAIIVQLSVSNPAPGGVSSAINFDVTYQAKVTVLDLPANDLVWDPYAQRIYASLPSSYGVNGNSIAVINPSNGKVTGYNFAGSEPNQLALSSDSQFLYAGLNGNGSVQRLVLPSFTPDIDVSLGTSSFGGLNTALSLQVFPSDPHSFAVAEGTAGCCGSSGLFFFKDANQLSNSVTFPTITDILFASANTMYGYSNGTVSQVTVNANGGTLGQQWNNLVEGTDIAYAAGLIYGNNGQVLNPTTGLLVGSYDVAGGCCNSSTQLLPASTVDRVFALGNTPFFSSFGITSYDLAKFTPLAAANLSQLSGSTTPTFIRWGSSGLAFVIQTGCCGSTTSQVVLVQSPTLLGASGTKNPVPVAQSLVPSSINHGGGNFPVTVKGASFVPGSQVSWNGTALATTYLSPTQLTVYVPAGEVTASGTASVVVTNPPPGGGTAAALTFTIN